MIEKGEEDEKDNSSPLGGWAFSRNLCHD